MNRRGSYIAEAAVVLPVTVLAIITVVLILMFFYEESVKQSRLHMELRKEAASVTGHLPKVNLPEGNLPKGLLPDYRDSADEQYSGRLNETAPVLEVSRDGVFKNIHGHVYVRMISRGLMSTLKESEISCSWHGADGVGFKRLPEINLQNGY